jgi:serine/threonine protein kinase
VVLSNLHQSVIDQVRARIGTTLKKKWHLDALIGMGGMAAVYAATPRTGARVAVKMLHPALSVNDAVRKRFAREGYVANKIGHPGVARVLDDAVADDGSAFIVMELLEGETAAARAERHGGKLPVHEVAFIGEAVADVLAAAHASHVIHRDIKPDNVFVTHEGRVVVLDFGIARVADAAGVSGANTRTGTMMGTPAFMPPEQARGRANEMDATSDVWALGATLFWLASGRVVHEAETANEQLVAAATLPPVSLGRIAPDVPAPLVTVIDHALEYAKENRFRDAVAMKQALHAAVLAIAWRPEAKPGISPSGRPQASDDDTAVDVSTLEAALASGYRPLASTLPRSGLDDATTLAQRGIGARAPTIGPVEVGGQAPRTTQFLRAAGIGALVGVTVLLLVAVAGRTLMSNPHGTPSVEEPLPYPTTTSELVNANAKAVPEPRATQEISSATADTATPPLPSAITSTSQKPAMMQGHRNWLDRRK